VLTAPRLLPVLLLALAGWHLLGHFRPLLPVLLLLLLC
jgi:hypothetical protein